MAWRGTRTCSTPWRRGQCPVHQHRTALLSSGQPPEGYFALRCEDGMVSITQDGRELDVYGDGWYTEDDLWFVPGYENFPMDADARNIQVYLAAASDPKPMVYGNYLGSGAEYLHLPAL